MRQFAFKVTFATVVVACAALVSSTAAAAPAVAARPQYLHGGLGDLKILGPHLAWAVGSARPHSGDGPLLAQRWDGTRWRRVTVPAEPGHDAGFIKVDGSSPDDVWAIGAYTEGPAILSFADHWDGSSWTRVHIPNVHRLPYISLLQGLSVVSTDDAWASGTDGSDRPWVLHWNGTAWTRVPCPDFGGQWGTNIWGIAAFSADDATIVGEVGTRSGTGRTFAAHWDGTTWTRMTTPNIAGKLQCAVECRLVVADEHMGGRVRHQYPHGTPDTDGHALRRHVLAAHDHATTGSAGIGVECRDILTHRRLGGR